MATLANELLHNKYSQHLKIFTDGSKLLNGRVGCAFVIPELKVSKQYRLNDDVSIFTAELFAILMALTYINDLPVNPHQIVICTDSLSSIQALLYGSKNRSELLYDIQIIAHQIIATGTPVDLQWVPSHVGLGGNEMADAAAKSATGLPQVTTDLGFSLAEVYSKLQEAGVAAMANPPTKLETPTLPPSLTRIFRRLRTGGTKFKLFKPKCPCGAPISYEHIFDSCSENAAPFRALHEYVHLFGLYPQDFFTKHKILGWAHASLMCRQVYHSLMGAWV